MGYKDGSYDDNDVFCKYSNESHGEQPIACSKARNHIQLLMSLIRQRFLKFDSWLDLPVFFHLGGSPEGFGLSDWGWGGGADAPVRVCPGSLGKDDSPSCPIAHVD